MSPAGTEHLLLGLMREGDGIAAGVLESLGLTLEHLREARETSQAPVTLARAIARSAVVTVPLGETFGVPSGQTVATKPRCCSRTTRRISSLRMPMPSILILAFILAFTPPPA
jgi:hypothetical protein